MDKKINREKLTLYLVLRRQNSKQLYK